MEIILIGHILAFGISIVRADYECGHGIYWYYFVFAGTLCGWLTVGIAIGIIANSIDIAREEGSHGESTKQ